MDYLYIGSNGFVSKIDPRDGTELWRTPLKKGIFGTSRVDVNVVEHQGVVYAGAMGLLYGVDANSGEVLWTNELDGMGHNDISLCIAGKAVQVTGKEPEES